MPARSNNPTAPANDSLASIAAGIKSNIRNILLASPDFPRLYADVVISSAPNSPEAKLLARNYEKICGRTTMTTKSCTHIKVTGVRCGSPALRGEPFCYFHQRMIRTVKGPNMRLHHVALLEDEESIQASLMEVVNALIRGTIEVKRGELILRALNTAVRNIRRARFDIYSKEMIRELPNYDEQQIADAEKSNVGTAAPESLPQAESKGPSGPAVPVHGAVSSAVSTIPTTPKQPPQRLPHPSQFSKEPAPSSPKNGSPAPNAQQRKTPASIKDATAPKERKIAAHRASGG